MALFKIFKGTNESLPTSYTEGYCYYCTDTGLFYIDTTNDASGRQALNAKDALTLMGKEVEEVLTSSKDNIPTSNAVMTYITTVETELAALSTRVDNMIQFNIWEDGD